MGKPADDKTTLAGGRDPVRVDGRNHILAKTSAGARPSASTQLLNNINTTGDILRASAEIAITHSINANFTPRDKLSPPFL